MITLRFSRGFPRPGPSPLRKGTVDGWPVTPGAYPAPWGYAGKVKSLSILISSSQPPCIVPVPEPGWCREPSRTGAAPPGAPFMGTDATYDHGGLV
jgi:hypothetical protein